MCGKFGFSAYLTQGHCCRRALCRKIRYSRFENHQEYAVVIIADAV